MIANEWPRVALATIAAVALTCVVLAVVGAVTLVGH